VQNPDYDPFDAKAPFTVSPASATIPAGGERSFQVAFEEKAIDHFEALLLGHPTHPHGQLLPSGAHSDKHPDMKLRLAGDTLTPGLDLSERSKLKFKVASTQPKEHPSYTRPLILTNPSTAPLEFSIAVAAPFVLVEATASAAQFKLLGKTTISDKSPFVLPPKASLKLIISYIPPRRRRKQGDGSQDDDDSRSVVSSSSTLKTERTADVREAIDQDPHVMHRTTTEAVLTITFSNGTVQTFPLVAVITSPFLELSEPSLVFKRCHIDADRELELGLFNPSEVDAAWSLSHIPAPKPAALSSSKRAAAAAAAAAADAPADEPGVFVFSAEKGVVPARGGNIPERHPLRIRFKPKAAGRYKSIFMFKVTHGISTRFEVSAEATLREEDLDIIPPERHLRLIMPGMLS